MLAAVQDAAKQAKEYQRSGNAEGHRRVSDAGAVHVKLPMFDIRDRDDRPSGWRRASSIRSMIRIR